MCVLFSQMESRTDTLIGTEGLRKKIVKHLKS